MNQMAKRIAFGSGLATLLAVLGCTEEQAGERARPVTVIELSEIEPARLARLSGVVEPHRAEDIGFEVSGRTEMVQDKGVELEGVILAEDGSEREGGGVIAALDSTRYAQSLAGLEAQKKAANEGLKAARIDRGQVATADLANAKAQLTAAGQDRAAADQAVVARKADLDLARVTLRRQKELEAKGTISKAMLDEAQSRYDAAVAAVQQAEAGAKAKAETLASYEAAVLRAEGSIALKDAQIEQTLAEIQQLDQEMERARTDLADCVLRAPFAGRITEKHVDRGAFVQAGRKIATLTAFDPIKVALTVSEEEERRVAAMSQAVLYPRDASGTEVPLYGVVFEKGSVADAATRTFRIEVIVRNVRMLVGAPAEGARDPLARGVMPVLKRLVVDDGSIFVEESCVLREGDDVFVLRVPGAAFGRPSTVDLNRLIRPEKVPIKLTGGYYMPGKWVFREVDTAGGDAKVAYGDMLVQEARKEHLEGCRLARYDWLLRPGDLVPVELRTGAAPKGIYVPVQAIRTLNGEASVFVVGDDSRAKRIRVTVGNAYRELRRIEGEGIEPGQRLILQGVHFAADGETVTVLETERI